MDVSSQAIKLCNDQGCLGLLGSGSLYLPEAVYEALRETAFHERCKIHDLVMEGIGLALKKRNYPSIDALKTGRKR
jgi:hypothetical protein